jgi:hypothetical protein
MKGTPAALGFADLLFRMHMRIRAVHGYEFDPEKAGVGVSWTRAHFSTALRERSGSRSFSSTWLFSSALFHSATTEERELGLAHRGATVQVSGAFCERQKGLERHGPDHVATERNVGAQYRHVPPPPRKGG